MRNGIDTLLAFWFGDLGVADLPTSDRTNLWFGENAEFKQAVIKTLNKTYQAALLGKKNKWAHTPRGRLALIILLDQISRLVKEGTPQVFDQDKQAQQLCLEGVENKVDQSLMLIERVFFYMPLVHAENIEIQEKSIRLFQQLVSLSMSETIQVYQLFLAYAYAHFRVIKEFGRFPQRNNLLGRASTEAEIVFLKDA